MIPLLAPIFRRASAFSGFGNSSAASIASPVSDGYHEAYMRYSTCRALLALLALLLATVTPQVRAANEPQLFPLASVQPGMKGYMQTIFTGDAVERVDLEVIGVMHNAMGPKTDIILVRLLGDKAAESGVVAGMSGSPVYFDGKLAGALSLKIGSFTKEAIAGVTPIAEMLEVEKSSDAGAAAGSKVTSATPLQLPDPLTKQVSIGAGQMLTPIETPLISSGFYPDTLAQFGKTFASWGMSAAAGGSAAPSADDAKINPGDMVGIDMIRGDLSLSSGCTVTYVDATHLLACGHPIFGFGSVALGLSRAHVIMTLNSSLASTKIIDTGGTIGTLVQDRQTAVMGTFGAGPVMIPVHLTVDSAAGAKNFVFEVVPSPQLTPQLVAMATFNGIQATPDFGGGKTLQFEASIAIKDHSPVVLQDLFASSDPASPTGMAAAISLGGAFSAIYSNPYEIPQIEKIDLHVKEVSEQRIAVIDSAWTETTEAKPGQTVPVKVALHPYRGAPFVAEIPVKIPEQTPKGMVALVISDASFLNRNVQVAAYTSAGRLPGLEELIGLVNRERRNDRLYATLVQSSPTLYIEDKEMPNAPTSAINILDQRQGPDARLQGQSIAGEWSVPMDQVISGQQVLSISIK
jgi:hypothetical protein